MIFNHKNEIKEYAEKMIQYENNIKVIFVYKGITIQK